MASVASTLSVDGLSADDEPPKKQKVLVGIILAADCMYSCDQWRNDCDQRYDQLKWIIAECCYDPVCSCVL